MDNSRESNTNRAVNDNINYESAFKEWIKKQISAKGGLFSDNTINQYSYALRNVCTKMDIIEYPNIKNIFDVDSIELFTSLKDCIHKHPDYEELNKNRYSNGSLNAALSNYEAFLKSTISMQSKECIIQENPDEKNRYTSDDFLSEVYMDRKDYDNLLNILKRKKNIILQGAPGVGKTFAAKRLAYSLMGVVDKERVMMIQFHQSYSYEDFIMGFRPISTGGFELKRGVFYNFCKKAENDPDNDYFFVIDEINRGNLSKIFGELFMLIETEKRGDQLQLLYSDEFFSVPKNVYIIGMMNTADRSLAMLDYALRRRFAFVDLKPGFNTEGFRKYRDTLANKEFNKLIDIIEELNNSISQDDSLGEGFCIGHSYFCNLNAESIDYQKLSSIIEYELIPLLKEYWFDEPNKVKEWSNNLRSAIK